MLTGDVIESTKLDLEEREIMIDTLKSIPDRLSPLGRFNIELFRGDSFQLRVSDAKASLIMAICIRAFLRAHRMRNSDVLLDARIAIGIGSIGYSVESIGESDGEAFRNSGHLLDKMDKKRLAIKTPWKEVNDELAVSTAFVDDIVSSWTQSQSRIELANFIYHRNRNDISQNIGVSRQMVDKSLKASKANLICAYIDRFEKLLLSHTISEI